MDLATIERRLRRVERINRVLLGVVAVLGAAHWLNTGSQRAAAQVGQRALHVPLAGPIAPLPTQLDNSALLKGLEPPPITPMVRTRALEIVDVDGKRRAWISTDASKNALVGLFDASDRLRVTLTVGAQTGLSVLDSSGSEAVTLTSGADRSLGTKARLKLKQGAVVLDDDAGNHMVGMRLQANAGDIWLNRTPDTKHIEIASLPMPGSSGRLGSIRLTAEDGVASAGFFVGSHIANVSAFGGVNRAGFEAGGERHMGFLRARTTVRMVQSEVLAIPTRLGGDINDLLRIEPLPK